MIVDVASAQTLQEARATSALEAINQQMYSPMLGPGLQTNMSWDIAVALNFGATSRETSMTEMPLTHKKCCVECSSSQLLGCITTPDSKNNDQTKRNISVSPGPG